MVLAAGFVWLNDLADPTPEASAGHGLGRLVTVTAEGRLVFQPSAAGHTGFIFYPGGRVAPEAYAPPMRAIAEAGYLAVITPMPFGLAVLAPDAADAVIETHPEIEHWVIGGHSLGGAMAAQYTAGHDDAIDGLALWAAYPAGGHRPERRRHHRSPPSRASNDGLATPDEIEASAAQLPPDTTFVEIEGGNHAEFGWYGEQAGDGAASIPARSSRTRRWLRPSTCWRACRTAGDGPGRPSVRSLPRRGHDLRLGTPRTLSLSPRVRRPALSSTSSTSKRCSPGASGWPATWKVTTSPRRNETGDCRDDVRSPVDGRRRRHAWR